MPPALIVQRLEFGALQDVNVYVIYQCINFIGHALGHTSELLHL